MPAATRRTAEQCLGVKQGLTDAPSDRLALRVKL